MPDSQALMVVGVATVPQQPGTMPLSTLVEYIIQSTYHELVVLSELLPRKTDMERKIEIVQFASRTRQLFVRLLALVKWANSATKVDKCAMISSFLDQQAMLFVDTADMLAKMSRVTLVRARLPSFSIPCAIDVLTTGTYPRLPTCIKERIVPPDPITPQEKWQTLMRLNQIIEHRLVTTDLPTHMKRPKIQNGRVKFRVEHEFEVTLTLMGDGTHIPWRLLDIEILVEDPETGDGKALVHSLQINYIHQLVQARLMDNEQPLDDLYSVLHSFCQSLQLEVLHSQTERLIHQRLGEHMRIEDYTAGSGLVLSYWREARRRGAKPPTQTFKLNIYVEKSDLSKPLQISHFPQIQGSESTKVAQAIRSDYLSVEKLLVHTIQVRSLARLKELEREFRLIVPGPCETRDLPSILYVPVVYPCNTAEMLSVAVNIQNGQFLVSLCSKEIKITNEIEESLNGDRRDLRRCLSKLRLWIGLQRGLKSAQHMGVKVHESLAFTNLSGHPLEKLGRSHLFISLTKQTNHYLVVEAQESRKRQLQYNYYMLHVEPSSTPEGNAPTVTPSSTPAGGNDQGSGGESLQPVYVKAGHMMQLDTFACTHGPSARIHDEEEEINSINRKRKLLLGDTIEPPLKKMKGSAYFVSELTHILALCEDFVPLMALSSALEKRDMAHQGLEVTDDGAGLALTLLSPPKVSGLSEEGEKDLLHCLLSLKFRIHRKGTQYSLEAIFSKCPVNSTTLKECGPCQRVTSPYDILSADSTEKTVHRMVEEWTGLARLYDAVVHFAAAYQGDRYLQSEVEVKSYTYKELTLAYGPNKCYTCYVTYRSSDSRFHLMFGTVGPSSVANCHTVMRNQLQRELNNTKSISRLAQTLADTWCPLQSLGKLNSLAMQGIALRPTQPVPSFTLLPQSPTHVRVAYRQIYCLDIHCRGNRMVAVRDGAYSKFESSKVVDGLNPIPGLKAFLNLYVDETATAHAAARRRSTVEDDNPPSPLGMDMDTFMAQQNPAAGSPAAAGGNRGKFQSPLTPTSNPCTPASPAASRAPGSNQPVIAPSPSSVMAAPSPGNPALHVPSPSSFVTAPSPSSLGIHMPSPAATFISPQGMVEAGSPAFPPGARGGDLTSPGRWETSPSVNPGPSPRGAHTSPQTGAASVLSPPTRVLPQRSWAASVPTLLTHDALGKLASPVPAPAGSGSNVAMSALERFLGVNFLRRQLVRIVGSDDQMRTALAQMTTSEPGVVVIKSDTIQMKFIMHPQTLQTFSMKVMSEGGPWDQEEMSIVEKFFDIKVAVYPFRASVVQGFMRLMAAPLRILKDLVQIMRLELAPEKTWRWTMQWCLTMPQGAPPPMGPYGNAMVLLNQKGKILFMLQLTHIVAIPPVGTSESQTTIFVPILHDMNTNMTQYYHDQRQPPPSNPATQAIMDMFKRFHSYNAKPNECSLYPAVRELLSNLQIP